MNHDIMREKVFLEPTAAFLLCPLSLGRVFFHCLLASGFFLFDSEDVMPPCSSLWGWEVSVCFCGQDPDGSAHHVSPRVCAPVVKFFKYIIGLLLVEFWCGV